MREGEKHRRRRMPHRGAWLQRRDSRISRDGNQQGFQECGEGVRSHGRAHQQTGRSLRPCGALMIAFALENAADEMALLELMTKNIEPIDTPERYASVRKARGELEA